MSKFRHEKGEYVVYKANGVCRITDIVDKSTSESKEETYYVMKPIYNESATVYIPTDSDELNESLRPVLTENEINSLIDELEHHDDSWTSDHRQRAEKFAKILSGGDRAEILNILKLLSLRKIDAEKDKKTLNAGDTKALASAEK